jgi:hypothetical protein
MTKMVRAAALMAALVVAVPVFGAEWTAEIVEDEGGPRMMASIAGTGGGDVPPEIFMFCGGGEISLRYSFGSGVGEGVQMPNQKPLPFVWEFGNGSVTLDMQYEEYDGAFAAYFPKDHKIMDLFKSAATVIIDDPTKLYQVQSFPLTGSSDAIDKLLGACD